MANTPHAKAFSVSTDPGQSQQYLGAYAGEMAWREDHRRKSNGVQYLMMAGAALAHPVSRQWKGYWQRRAAHA